MVDDDGREGPKPKPRPRGGVQRSICRGFAHWLIDRGQIRVPPGDYETQKELAVTELVAAYFSEQKKGYR